MRSTRRLLVALVAGVIAAGLLIVVLTQAYSQRGAATGQSSSGPTVSIVVASAPGGGTVAAGTKLTASNLRLASYPESQYRAGSFLIDTKQAVGQYISVGLPDGAPILQSFLLSDAPSASNTVSRAPLPIDKGMEAIGIPFDPAKDVGGYIQPGDYLDILIQAPDGQVHYGFQDVRVLRVNAAANAASTGTVVVEMTPQKVAALAYLYSHAPQNVIRFVLRPATSSGTQILPDTKAVGGSNWSDFLDS